MRKFLLIKTDILDPKGNWTTIHGFISAVDEHEAARVVSSEIEKSEYKEKDSYSLKNRVSGTISWKLQEIHEISLRPAQMNEKRALCL